MAADALPGLEVARQAPAAASPPQRIQLRRVKGWRLPDGALSVARPTRWGNPYVVHEHEAACYAPDVDRFVVDPACPEWSAPTALEAAAAYGWALRYRPPGLVLPTMAEIRLHLAGHDLACWCPLTDPDGSPVPCHADVLLDIANSREDPT